MCVSTNAITAGLSIGAVKWNEFIIADNSFCLLLSPLQFQYKIEDLGFKIILFMLIVVGQITVIIYISSLLIFIIVLFG
jgi:hypothetical protein